MLVARSLCGLVVGGAACALLLVPSSVRAEPPAAIDDWNVEKADDGIVAGYGNRAIGVDSTGQAWIAYGGDSLRVAHGGPGGFTIETVDPLAGAGGATSVRVDSSDVPHVAYIDRARGLLRYAKRAGGVWTTETVASYATTCAAAPHVGVSLELDASGKPRIAYGDLLRPALVLATKTGSSWSTDVIDAAATLQANGLGAAGGECSLAIDAGGTAHVCYSRGNALWHAKQRAGGWATEVVQDKTTAPAGLGDQGQIGGSPSLVVDKAGHLHVSYVDGHYFGQMNYHGMYATNASGKWKYSEMSVPAYRVVWTSLAIDSQDVLHLATESFDDFGPGGPSYGTFAVDADAVIQTFADTTAGTPAVCVAPDGKTHLVADPGFASHFGIAHFVSSGSSSWTRTNFDRPADFYGPCGLVFDSAGRPNLTRYYSAGFVVRREGANWVRSSFASDALANVQVQPGVTADLHALFQRHTANAGSDVYLASFSGGVWTTATLGTFAYSSLIEALLVKKSGAVHAFYESAPTGTFEELRCFVQQPGGSFVDELVDLGAQTTGAFRNVVALEGTDGRVHVVYKTDSSPAAIRHAVRDPGGWTVETVDASSALVSDLSAAFDTSGNLHASYYSTDDGNLHEFRYATNATGSWVTEVIHTPTIYYDWDHAEMAVVGDTPHVVYIRYSPDRALVEGERGPGGWTTRVIDANVSLSLHLAADAAGVLHVGYTRDPQSVWYATYDGTAWRTAAVDDGGIGNPTFGADTLNVALGTTSVDLPVTLARLDGPGYFALALDATGAPHFATVLASLNDVRYASLGFPLGAQLGTVDYATVSGSGADSAQAGQDFTATSGTFQWALGDGGARTIHIPLTPNAAHVGDLSFKVDLSHPTGFDRTGACPEATLKIRNVPVGTLVSYFLPKNVNLAVNAKTPAKSKLVAAGFFDTGLAGTDLSAAATLTVGGASFSIPAQKLLKNGVYRYKGQGVDFTITPQKSGSSRATFKLSVTRDFTGQIDPNGPLTLRFRNAAVDGTGVVGLQKGKYTLGRLRGALTSPTVFLYAGKATIAGGGKDALTLKAGLGALGGTPATAPDVTIAFGSKYSVTLTSAKFVKGKGESFVLTKGAVPGVTSCVLDYAKETFVFTAKGIDVGPFASGAQSVLVTVGAGAPRTVLVRMVRAGKTLVY